MRSDSSAGPKSRTRACSVAYGGRQGTAVRGTRFVEAEVRLEAAGDDLIGDQVVQHQDVGLLDHLGAVDALGPRSRSAAMGRRGAASAMINGSSRTNPANCS